MCSSPSAPHCCAMNVLSFSQMTLDWHRTQSLLKWLFIREHHSASERYWSSETQLSMMWRARLSFAKTVLCSCFWPGIEAIKDSLICWKDDIYVKIRYCEQQRWQRDDTNWERSKGVRDGWVHCCSPQLAFTSFTLISAFSIYPLDLQAEHHGKLEIFLVSAW